jgi:hypothetical protein
MQSFAVRFLGVDDEARQVGVSINWQRYPAKSGISLTAMIDVSMAEYDDLALLMFCEQYGDRQARLTPRFLMY